MPLHAPPFYPPLPDAYLEVDCGVWADADGTEARVFIRFNPILLQWAVNTAWDKDEHQLRIKLGKPPLEIQLVET